MLFGKRQFYIVVRIGDNGHFGDFRSRSGGRGDDNGGKQLFTAVEKIGPHVIPQLAPLDGQKVGNLGRVDDTPAPDRDKQIATLPLGKGGTFFNRLDRGVGRHLIESRPNFDGRGFKSAFDFFNQAGFR